MIRTTTDLHLFDLATGELLGLATDEQVNASLRAACPCPGVCGHELLWNPQRLAEHRRGNRVGGGILVAENGSVVTAGTPAARRSDVRAVFAA